MQTIITEKQKLLNAKGVIENPGFAFTPVWEYNRKDIKAPKWRIKEWDYYLICNEDVAVAFTISDLAYLGMISVSLIDLKKPLDRTNTKLTALPMGNFKFPGDPYVKHVVQYNAKDLQIKFDVADGRRHLTCHFENFFDGKTLDADLTLYEEYKESMVIATPWKEKPTCFYYNQKQNCLGADGVVTLGDEKHVFERHKHSGCLDWGRGVWTYDNTWYWGTGSGFVNGKSFGLNWGYGFSDRSSASENVVFYDGKVHKLSEVFFNIPKDANGKEEYEKQWTITSDDNRVNGVFNPIIDRNSLTDLNVIISDQHQVFGNFVGDVVLDGGEVLHIDGFLCALEKVRNKY